MIVEIRKHLMFVGREIILRKVMDLPLPPFKGLEIEFEGPIPTREESDRFWTETVDSVMVGASGTIVVWLEWGERVGEFDFSTIACYPGFEILWDSKTHKSMEGH